MRKKRWFIGGILLFFVITIMTACFWVLEKNKSIEEIKIDDNLYYKKLDTDKIIYNKDFGRVVSNELIIQTDDTEKEIMEELVEKENGKIVGYIDLTNTYQIEFANDIKPDDLMMKKQEFERNESVKYVAYNYVFSAENQISYQSLAYPNDKEWKDKWGSDMTEGNWGLKAIKVPEAWNFMNNAYRNLEEINMGVLELGPLYVEHEDLKENLGSVVGIVDKDKASDSTHGTQVTGIIGAGYDNKQGITGVMMNNEKINYFSYNWAKDHGEDTTMSYLVGLSSLVIKTGKDQTAVINASFGTDLYQVAGTNNVKAAIVEATDINNVITNHLKSLLSEGYDFLIVKAAGNATNEQFLHVDVDNNDNQTLLEYVPYLQSDDPEYDKYAKYYETYKDELDERIFSGEVDATNDTFSGITDEEIKDRIIVVGGIANPEGNNYPRYSFSSKGERIDIVAPATKIQSTTFDNNGSKYAENLYGTSFAAPYVSGVAGLMLSVKPDLTGKELKTILIKTGSGDYNFGIDSKTHNVPLVNAEQAVEKAANYDRNKITVVYDHKIENNKEYATISGVNLLDEKVWEYVTQKYECTELNRVSEIGTISGSYYFVENGKVVALNVSDGTVAWENKDFGGSVSAVAFDDNTIYLCGYYGPSFFAVDKNGATLGKIDSFGDEYYWPYAIEKIDDSTIAVTLEHGPEEAVSENEGFVFYVHLNDYSFSPIGINTVNIFDSMPSDFTFSSGAGGWATQFALEDDGSFTGQYYDSDMGDIGAEYPRGTVYNSKFTGKFTTPTQINDYTYSMRLENLQAEGTTGEEYYENGQRFIYSDPYGFDNADEFLIYTPGAPMDELPEGFKEWLKSFMNPYEEQTLPCYGIYNVGGEEGFVGFEDASSENESSNGSNITQETLVGNWLQTDSNDPMMLTLGNDGSIQYYATVSNENEYTSTFSWDGTLWLNLVRIDNYSTISVPYQVSLNQEENSIQMTLSLDKEKSNEDVAPLYGMESILEGTYQKIIQ